MFASAAEGSCSLPRGLPPYAWNGENLWVLSCYISDPVMIIDHLPTTLGPTKRCDMHASLKWTARYACFLCPVPLTPVTAGLRRAQPNLPRHNNTRTPHQLKFTQAPECYWEVSLWTSCNLHTSHCLTGLLGHLFASRWFAPLRVHHYRYTLEPPRQFLLVLFSYSVIIWRKFSPNHAGPPIYSINCGFCFTKYDFLKGQSHEIFELRFFFHQT